MQALYCSARSVHNATPAAGHWLTPAAFRLIARTHHAIAAIRLSRSPLCEIAHVSGFADQAHMSRAVSKLAGMSPALLRRLLKVTSEEKSLNEHGS